MPTNSRKNSDQEGDPGTAIPSSKKVTKTSQVPPKSKDIWAFFKISRKVKSDKRQVTQKKMIENTSFFPSHTLKTSK